MWTRNPTDRLPCARLALEYPSNDLDFAVASALAQSLGGEAHWCLGASPIAHPLDEPSTFSGTLQLCCFERAEGLSDENSNRSGLTSMHPWRLRPRTTSATAKLGTQFFAQCARWHCRRALPDRGG